MKTIGIIAGRGNFPILLAKEAKAAGYKVVAVCVKANTRRSLPKLVDKAYWVGVTEFEKISEIFRQEEVLKIAMAGQINPYSLFNPKVMSDPAVRAFFGNIQDRRADTIFSAFAKKLEMAGLKLLDSTVFLDKYLPKAQVISVRNPSEEEYGDMNFGFKIAKHLGGIDIGQSVCVKKGAILAVEAIEGTDNTIRRAAALARSAIVLVKASKPRQDMRFDVPVVGLKTVKNLPKGSCLAIEAKKTLFFDQAAAVRLANKKGIAIVSV